MGVEVKGLEFRPSGPTSPISLCQGRASLFPLYQLQLLTYLTTLYLMGISPIHCTLGKSEEAKSIHWQQSRVRMRFVKQSKEPFVLPKQLKRDQPMQNPLVCSRRKLYGCRRSSARKKRKRRAPLLERWSLPERYPYHGRASMVPYPLSHRRCSTFAASPEQAHMSSLFEHARSQIT